LNLEVHSDSWENMIATLRQLAAPASLRISVSSLSMDLWLLRFVGRVFWSRAGAAEKSNTCDAPIDQRLGSKRENRRRTENSSSAQQGITPMGHRGQ